MGTRLFETWVKRSKKYQKEIDNSEKQKMIDNSFDQACAYRFIDGADKDKCGSFVQQLRPQYGLRNDQCPKKLAQALDALSTHQWDAAYKEKQKQKKANQKPNGNNKNNNNSNKPNGNNFAQKKGNKLICF